MLESSIKKKFHQSRYRGCTARWKPQMNLKNRKNRFEFARKKMDSSETTSCGQMRQRSMYSRILGREDDEEGKELLTGLFKF